VTSQIIETNPTSGSATTSSVRVNFGHAKTEISELQRMTKDRVVTSTVNAMTADFATNVVLAEGVRITVEIGDTNTQAGASVTLNVDNTNPKQVVRQDGSDIAIGDLKAGQYADLIYDATSSGKWVWLNSPYAQLITSLKEEIAANVYPVGSIFTTTTNYSDSSNGAAVTTALGMASTVQWSRYAKGRTIVGFDSGYTPSAATASANDVIQLTFTASEGESGQLHPFGVGDTITTSGFTTSQANVTSGTVTEVTANTIKYASSSSISSGATVTIGSGKVVNTAMDVALEAGGASNHTLSQAEMNHNHHVYDYNAGGYRSIRITDEGTHGKTFNASADAVAITSGSGGHMTIDMFTDNNRNITGETVTPHNNLQPYITTYIWKRTA